MEATTPSYSDFKYILTETQKTTVVLCYMNYHIQSAQSRCVWRTVLSKFVLK